MKILLVIDEYASSNNGTSISFQRFAEELRRQGNEVRVLCTTENTDAEIYALPELHLPILEPLIHSYGFHFAKPVEATIREALAWADIAHCMMPFLLTYHTKRIANEMNKPCTSAFHIQPENLLSGVNLGKVKWINNACYRLWRRYIYNAFDYIHTPSNFMRNELLKRNYSGDIRAISNGIADDFVPQTHYKSNDYDGKIVITMIGRLAHEKRQDLIIEATKRSRYANQIQLVFAGKGPMQEAYTKQGAVLANKPIFTYCNKEQLLDLLAQTDLYVHASDMESEAIACIEAFATGLVPIISDSDNSATSQFAIDSRCLFEAGNAQSLTERIDYWIEHSAERQAMEQRYAAEAQKYRLCNSVSQCIDMFNAAIAQQNKKAI